MLLLVFCLFVYWFCVLILLVVVFDCCFVFVVVVDLITCYVFVVYMAGLLLLVPLRVFLLLGCFARVVWFDCVCSWFYCLACCLVCDSVVCISLVFVDYFGFVVVILLFVCYLLFVCLFVDFVVWWFMVTAVCFGCVVNSVVMLSSLVCLYVLFW